MKREIEWYVEIRLTCRMVKAEHQRPHDKLQPLEVPMWKYEQITMDFSPSHRRLPRVLMLYGSSWID